MINLDWRSSFILWSFVLRSRVVSPTQIFLLLCKGLGSVWCIHLVCLRYGVSYFYPTSALLEACFLICWKKSAKTLPPSQQTSFLQKRLGFKCIQFSSADAISSSKKTLWRSASFWNLVMSPLIFHGVLFQTILPGSRHRSIQVLFLLPNIWLTCKGSMILIWL